MLLRMSVRERTSDQVNEQWRPLSLRMQKNVGPSRTFRLVLRVVLEA